MLGSRRSVTFGVLMILVVDVQNVKSKLEKAEDTEAKCPKKDEGLRLDNTCVAGEDKLGVFLSLQNGEMEKNLESCSLYNNQKPSKMEPIYVDLDAPSATELTKSEIKKNLNWIRFTEYSQYGKNLIRSNKWESVQGETIIVVTYNVLSQVLLEKHRYLYKNHDERALNWETRSQTLLNELADFNADILCLQEIDSALLNSFYNKNLNDLGYTGIYKQRTNDKVDGCAVYFKKAKFDLIKYTSVELYKQAVHLLDRDNIGIVLKLSLKSNPSAQFIVATTHLLYNPRRGDIKLAQTQLMLAEIEKLAYKAYDPRRHRPEYLPIIFTGDMNYKPDNGVYQLVTKSFLEYEGTSSEKLVPSDQGHILNKTLLSPRVGITDSCQYVSSLLKRKGAAPLSFSSGTLDHHLNLESVYEHVKSNLPEATTNQTTWVTVDYIFYSKYWDENLKVRRERGLKLISKLTLPNTKEAEEYLKHIPNLACGSDHLPLVATFHLTES